MHRLVAASLLLLKHTFARHDSPKAEFSAEPPRGAGLVLPKDTPVQDWSSGGMGGPVVHPPDEFRPAWRMWYYGCAANGRNTSQHPSCPGGIPYGCVGMAFSTDGLHWVPHAKNPVFLPSTNLGAFDESRVAVGSVVNMGRGNLAMYYFGSDDKLAPAI